LGEEETKKNSFGKLYNNANDLGAKIIIFVLNTAPQNTESHYWEYACDVIIKLNNEERNQYFLKNIEIVKARYQEHVLGKQPFKILPQISTTSNNNNNPYHPYYKDGGVFIFPSIHYHNSESKRNSENNQNGQKVTDDETSENESIPKNESIPENESIEEFNKFLKPSVNDTEKGIPQGKSSVFIGKRGSHKSHFALMCLLDRFVR
jgi:hypothetical protein